jgi:flagellar biosynthesis/type III secretory pathway M-ring protein FliF/YscJ
MIIFISIAAFFGMILIILIIIAIILIIRKLLRASAEAKEEEEKNVEISSVERNKNLSISLSPEQNAIGFSICIYHHCTYISCFI